ncbi:glutamate ligase domain-containing protein [Sphingomonas canadensis]|uniref:Glutamate ligase domain-containing protein n=1 Tax=Sphingomonas canadensis TaxID=1219257 RepID=A0ABW3HBQ5_9SPHN|nr:Mur ligase family protein [Sphingomonas canadensis]MCW3836485.1 Mur ligase family protein [Sphingomonas canadensis]
MDHRKPYFFVGIGGSGMMPLAMILAGQGAVVAGSDRSLDQATLPAKFDWLRRRGIALFPQDGSGVASPEQIVVASAAVEASVPDMVRAAELGNPRMSRAELLAGLFNAAPLSVGVAGTSGKSTVTGMTGWILHAAGMDPTVMNGAVMKNFATPDAPFASALVGGGHAFVSEVDESDGSIELYSPSVAVLNNVSLDHKSMEELRVLFGDFVAKARIAVINAADAEAAALIGRAREAITFAVEQPADFVAENLAPEPFAIAFDLVHAGVRDRIRLAVPGRHNVANALAAIAAAIAAGVPRATVIAAIQGFSGLKRRFELVGEGGGVAVIDDFGHNPEKIAATVDTLHEFPGRLLLMFQPHGFGPLKVMRRELVAMFVQRLADGDLLVMPDPVYHGGTVNREVSSADIIADIAAAGGNALHIADRAEAAAHLVSVARPGDRIVLMGARDDTLSHLAADMAAKLRG